MKYYKDFSSMYNKNVAPIPVCVFNWTREKSPDVFVVMDDTGGFGEEAEVCRMFESPTSAIPGKERTFEVVVNDKYVDYLSPAFHEYCEKYFFPRCYRKLGVGHYAFNCSRVIGSLHKVLEQEIDILNRIVNDYLEKQLVKG